MFGNESIELPIYLGGLTSNFVLCTQRLLPHIAESACQRAFSFASFKRRSQESLLLTVYRLWSSIALKK